MNRAKRDLDVRKTDSKEIREGPGVTVEESSSQLLTASMARDVLQSPISNFGPVTHQRAVTQIATAKLQSEFREMT